MRRILLPLMIFAVLGPLPGGYRPLPPVDHSNRVVAASVPGVEPGRRIGALILAEAWELSSQNTVFGGVSGMALTGPRRFQMVSDSGKRLNFVLDERGRVSESTIRDLPPLKSSQTGKRYLDAEAMTRDPRTGNIWIGLEGIAQLWRFDARGKRTAQLRNWAMYRWPVNGGTESLARLSDGRFVAFSERLIKDGLHEGLLFGGDPAERRSPYIRFYYDDGGQGSVTDAAALPDGRVVILHRKLGLSPVFTTSVAIADLRDVRAGSILASRSIATINSHDVAENYEGLTIEQGTAGLSLWMVSDDNQNDWQRTRLLRFILDPAVLRTARKPTIERPTKKAAPSPARPS